MRLKNGFSLMVGSHFIVMIEHLLQILQVDFNHRDPEYQSVVVLCQRVQSSPDACPYIEDLNKLLDCSESFKTRWTGIKNKCQITKSLLEKRVVIYEVWYNDVRTLSEWLDERTEAGTFKVSTSSIIPSMVMVVFLTFKRLYFTSVFLLSFINNIVHQ